MTAAVDSIEHPDGRLPDEPVSFDTSKEGIADKKSSTGDSLEGVPGTTDDLYPKPGDETVTDMPNMPASTKNAQRIAALGVEEIGSDEDAEDILAKAQEEAAAVDQEIVDKKPAVKEIKTVPPAGLGGAKNIAVEDSTSQFTAEPTVGTKEIDPAELERLKADADVGAGVEDASEEAVEPIAEVVELQETEQPLSTEDAFGTVIERVDNLFAESEARSEKYGKAIEDATATAEAAISEADMKIGEYKAMKENAHVVLQSEANKYNPLLAKEIDVRKQLAENKMTLVSLQDQVTQLRPENNTDLAA